MPPRKKAAVADANNAPAPVVTDRVRIPSPTPAAPVDYSQSASAIFDQLISSMPTVNPRPPSDNYYDDNDYIPRNDAPVAQAQPVLTYNTQTPVAYAPAAATTSYGNAYTNNSNPAYQQTAYHQHDDRHSRARSPPRRRSPPRARSRSPAYRRNSRTPPPQRRGRSPSPGNRNRRKAPPIPTAVALDLLSWIPAYIWREHGYQPPIKL